MFTYYLAKARQDQLLREAEQARLIKIAKRAKRTVRSRRRHHRFLLITSAILILSMLAGCGPSAADLETVDFTPLVREGWEVSTPEEQGLDPMLVAGMYYD
jgi:hypothetical protein